MDEDNNLPYFFLGLGLGVAVGLLFAPKAGSETRDMLLSKADEGREYLRRQTETLRDQAGDLYDKGSSAAGDLLDKSRTATNDLLDKGKTVVSKQKDQLNQAVEAGKQAYRDAVGSPTATGAPHTS